MGRPRITFNEHGVSGSKSGVCPKCGKPATRSKKFWQTHNPFNKNKEGQIKTIDEIMKECRDKLIEWKKEPTFHARCEP